MPGPATTLLIEGSFSELAEELAKYLDALDKSAGIEADISPTLAIVREQEQAEEPSNPQTVQKEKDDVLKKLVSKASILNGAPEKGKSSTTFVRSRTDHDRVQRCIQSAHHAIEPISHQRRTLCKVMPVSVPTTYHVHGLWPFVSNLDTHYNIQYCAPSECSKISRFYRHSYSN